MNAAIESDTHVLEVLSEGFDVIVNTLIKDYDEGKLPKGRKQFSYNKMILSYIVID